MDFFGPFAPYLLVFTVLIGALALGRGLTGSGTSPTALWADQLLKTLSGLALLAVLFCALWQLKDMLAGLVQQAGVMFWQVLRPGSVPEFDTATDMPVSLAWPAVLGFAALIWFAFVIYRSPVRVTAADMTAHPSDEPALGAVAVERLAHYLGTSQAEVMEAFTRAAPPTVTVEKKQKSSGLIFPTLGLLALIYLGASLYHMTVWNKTTATLTGMEEVCQYARTIGDHTDRRNITCDDAGAAAKLQAAGWALDRPMVAVTFSFVDQEGETRQAIVTHPAADWDTYEPGGTYELRYDAKDPSQADIPDPQEGSQRLLMLALAALVPLVALTLLWLLALVRRSLRLARSPLGLKMG